MAFLNMNSPTPNISQLWRNTHRNVSGVEAESRKDGGCGGYARHHVPFGLLISPLRVNRPDVYTAPLTAPKSVTNVGVSEQGHTKMY